jgi:hypothetical protein
MRSPASPKTITRLLPGLLFLSFTLLAWKPASGSLDDLLNSLRYKLKYYTETNPTSKVYLSCDKPLYEPGDVIWFNVICRAGNSLLPQGGQISVQLINPQGTVEATQSSGYNNTNSDFKGNFNLKPDQPGGLYKLKVVANNVAPNDNNLGFEREIQVQNVVMPRLKLTLDFERKAYGPGSQVVAKVKAFSNSNRPLTGNKFHFVVSLNGAMAQENDAIVDKKGNALVKFTLPEKLNSTDGNLNLIFRYEGLSESISRSIPIVLKKVDLAFFPEGGELVNGLESKLAFRALNEFKKPADISGDILDESGNQVASFSSFHDGMGEVAFKPLEGKSYKARITSPAGIKTTYPLPEAMINGYVLQVAKPEGETVKVNVRSSIAAKAGLLGQIRGQVHYQKMLDLKSGDNLVEFSTSQMPIGVLQLTLFDNKSIERAERLVFVNNHKQLQLKVKTDKEKYLPREKVRLTISAADETGMPMPADVVLSVTDDQMQTFMNDKSSTLLSWLLVESEIKGKVEEPKFYFDRTEAKAPLALDLLLKTAGWRRFTWETIKQVNLPQYQYSGDKLLSKDHYQLNFPPSPEYYKEFTGQAFINNTTFPLTDATVTLIQNGTRLAKTITNESGHFRFISMPQGKYDLEVLLNGHNTVLLTGIEIRQDANTNLTLHFPAPYLASVAENKKEALKVTYAAAKGGKAGLSGKLTDQITAEPIPFATVVVKQKGVLKGNGQTDATGNYTISPLKPGTYTIETPHLGYSNRIVDGIKVKEAKTTTLALGLSPDTRQLAEVQVTAYAAPIISPDRMGETITRREQIHKMATRDVSTVANTAVAVHARNMDGNIAVRGTRNEGTVYFVNGVKQLAAPNLPANQFGQAKKAPAPVSTRNLDGPSKTAGTKTVPQPAEPHNYTRIREFAAPVYAATENVSERTDFRKTLYWQPNIKIGRNGVTTVEFYTADAITSYNIMVEGISADGSPGRTDNKFFTQLPFSLAAKLPAASLENDQISVPIILKNNTEKDVTGKLEIKHPAGWKFTGKETGNPVVKANSSTTFYLDYQVSANPGTYEFAASFSADGLRDAFSQPVTVEQRGYPVNRSIAGSSKEADYQLDLSAMTPGTAQVSFVAYPTIVADLFKCVEGILREPSGCFEQTSSSSYPNLMVLDYLKEQEKPDASAVARAEELLDKGYNRLVTFETKENGYEWFGAAPAHEGLTAYGLMQFTDMQRVGGPVNTGMLERTKTWMLAQRDGKGGFKRNAKSLDSFGRADAEISNAYIVYSLAEAGYNDLKIELENTCSAALKSEDPYQLALATNALFTTGDKQKGKEFLAKLLQKQAPDGSWTGAKHSITYSTGQSLQIETTSLALLALLKADEKAVPEIQKAVKFLQGSRNGYGSFGSTQATVLALKAMTGFARYSKQTSESGTVQFYVEKKKAGEKEYAAGQAGEIVLDSLQQYFNKPGNYNVKVRYQKTNNALPYSLALNYYSNLPPASPECKVKLETTLAATETAVGSTVRYSAKLINLKQEGLPMTMAIIGIPAGLSVQPWQLKELQEKKVIDFYEINGNRLVCYFRDMAPAEEVVVNLDLKAEFPGTYESPAGSAYLYYTNEHKHWSPGTKISVKP